LDGKILTYPKQVVDELKRFAKGDLPLLWANSNSGKVPLIPIPDLCVKEVLQRVRHVLDTEKTKEEADPYILALALALQREGYNATVVTEETVDTPLKMSMAMACTLLNLPCQRIRDFLNDQRIWPEAANS